MRRSILFFSVAMISLSAISSTPMANALSAKCRREETTVNKVGRQVAMAESQTFGDQRLADYQAQIGQADAELQAAIARGAAQGITCVLFKCNVNGAVNNVAAQITRAKARKDAAEKRYSAFKSSLDSKVARLAKKVEDEQAKLALKQKELDDVTKKLEACLAANPGA
jgi:hypothetical protein